MKDLLKTMTKDEIVSQFEDRNAYCKHCESKRYEAKFEEMTDEFKEVYKYEKKNNVYYDGISFLYCYKCNNYSNDAEKYFIAIAS